MNCPECYGAGQLYFMYWHWFPGSSFGHWEPCDVCGGTGIVLHPHYDWRNEPIEAGEMLCDDCTEAA